MTFTVQIHDEQDRLLTEWLVGDASDGAEVDIRREIAWLREVGEGKTNAEALLLPVSEGETP